MTEKVVKVYKKCLLLQQKGKICTFYFDITHPSTTLQQLTSKSKRLLSTKCPGNGIDNNNCGGAKGSAAVSLQQLNNCQSTTNLRTALPTRTK